MALYQPAGSGIGTLLRMIREERSGSPLMAPSAETGSPIRESVQTPVYGAESPGGTRNVNIKPETPGTPLEQQPESAPLGPSRVGPLAIGGEDIAPIETPVPQEPQYNIPGKADINPMSGKAYAVNPESNVWDDNYWANVVEPALKAGTFNQPAVADIPSKNDINPATGKPYGVNPETGVWDDNYYANIAEPQLRSGTFNQPQQAQRPPEPQGQVLGTQITSEPPVSAVGLIQKQLPGGVYSPESQFGQLEQIGGMQAEYLTPPAPSPITPEEAKKFGEWFKKKTNQVIPTPTPTPMPTRIMGR